MNHSRLRRMSQAGRYKSPWPKWQAARGLFWNVTWLLLFRPTLKRVRWMGTWRLLLLRLFGCRMSGRPFVAADARVKYPWQLTLEHRACIGPRTEVYNLGHVTIRENAVVAQHVYICGGTHDFDSPEMELMVGDIEIGPDAFVGARAFIMPGIVIGARAIVGACAVVTKDVPPSAIVAGNPARTVKMRELKD